MAKRKPPAESVLLREAEEILRALARRYSAATSEDRQRINERIVQWQAWAREQ